MGQGYLMDTNTVIDFLNKKLPVSSKNIILNAEPIISVITHIELFSSSKTSAEEISQLHAFVNEATIYDHIDSHIVEQAINIRKKNRLKTPDAIIAATAIAYDLTLISRNTKDFDQVPELRLLNPWEMK